MSNWELLIKASLMARGHTSGQADRLMARFPDLVEEGYARGVALDVGARSLELADKLEKEKREKTRS